MSETVTKEELVAAINEVPPEKFEALRRFMRSLSRSNKTPKIDRETFMEKMRKIRIEAPPDFSQNLDDYLYGDKEI